MDKENKKGILKAILKGDTTIVKALMPFRVVMYYQTETIDTFTNEAGQRLTIAEIRELSKNINGHNVFIHNYGSPDLESDEMDIVFK